MSTPDVSIVGAAITGPATALALAKRGYIVDVYEQKTPDDLASAGILGITNGNWRTLVNLGVPVYRSELANDFRVYGDLETVTSPFRYIAWIDLHKHLTQTAESLGVRFYFGKRADITKLDTQYVIDAGGIYTAARNLTADYSGFAIYRGTSNRNTDDAFVVHHLPRGYFTAGYTAYGAAWALFAPRPEPQQHRTIVTAEYPPEADLLPAEFRRMIRETDKPIVSYMSDWNVPRHLMSRGGRQFVLGDANGPVRPVTTSGANLAILEGMTAPALLSGNRNTIARISQTILDRRRYDIALGQALEGPEIGGTRDDALFNMHHAALFLAGER